MAENPGWRENGNMVITNARKVRLSNVGGLDSDAIGTVETVRKRFDALGLCHAMPRTLGESCPAPFAEVSLFVRTGLAVRRVETEGAFGAD